MKLDATKYEASEVVLKQLAAASSMLEQVHDQFHTGRVKDAYAGMDFELLKRVAANVEAFAQES